MTSNLTLLCNFVEKYLGTIRFGNDQFASILGYGDLVQGNIMINRVYYVKGLNHNLFSVGQFCNADLEVAFQKSTCFVRDLQGNNLLTGNRGSDLYTISLQETTSSTPICLMAKASPTQAVSKAKRIFIQDKVVPSSKGRLNLLHMDLCGLIRVASINGKKHILVIVDDYSRYTWTLFLRSNDETLEVLKDFLIMIQQNLQALIISVQTDRGTKFLNKTLHAFFKEEEKLNIKLPLLEHLNRTALSKDKIVLWLRDGKNLDKMKEKGDPYILVGYSTQSKGYRVYNKRTQLIVESIHIKFDEIKEMTKMFVANDTSGLVPQRQKASDYDNSGPSSSHIDNSAPQDTPPTTNIHPTSEPSTPTNANAEENNDNQAENSQFQQHEFTNPFCIPVQENAESSSRNMVHGNPSKPVQTRRELATDPKICMFALTVSIAEPKNIKEAMADSAWIDAMHEELHQFDRLQVWELIDKPFGKNVIKLKWLWKKKKDEDQTVIRNKARLVS
ncbi:retrovirus-related pol polyprotein from transposon TNT 1-94 [Tanacetum coccineum]